MHRFLMRFIAGTLLATGTLGAMAAAATTDASADELVRIARDALRQVDEDRLGTLWDGSSGILKARVPREAFADNTRRARQTLGKVEQRDWLSVTRFKTQGQVQSLPAGTYANVEFTNRSANGRSGGEKLSFALDDKGRWRFTGYVANAPEAAAAAATAPPTAFAANAAAAESPASTPVAVAPREPASASRRGAGAAESKTAPLSPGAAVAEVESAVRAWADAWASRDMARYFDAYAPEVVPSGKLDRAGWEAERRRRIAGKERIEVVVDHLVVSIHGPGATARFEQRYRSDTVKETSPKTLELQRVNGRWLIRKESTG